MTSIGSYTVLEQIAEGGFGRIFRARHDILNKDACIKQNIQANPDSVSLLKEEASLLWSLEDHHSILKVKDFYLLSADNAALITSHIQGKTLDQFVRESGPLHPEDAAWITERLLEVQYFIHTNGIVHSDIKPENIFVEPEKADIKLIDFGLAASRPTRKTRPKGYTELYASPELIDGSPPIPESDIYGAGICLIYALSGTPDARQIPRSTPKQLAEFALALTNYNPEDRPCWNRNHPLKILSDIRQSEFGRRHRL